MRISNFIVIGLLLTISGCIPSLHGIVTDETRKIDDRILGTWISEPESLISGTFNLEPDSITVSERKALLLLDTLIATELVLNQWTFERMAALEFESQNGSTHHAMSEGASSMCPEGMKVTGKKDLPYYLLTHRETAAGDTNMTRMRVHLTEIADQLFLDFQPFKKGEDNKRFADNIIMGHTFARCAFKSGSLVIEPMDGEYILDLLEKKRIRLKHEALSDGSVVLTASTSDLRAFIQKYGRDSRLYADPEMLVQANEYRHE